MEIKLSLYVFGWRICHWTSLACMLLTGPFKHRWLKGFIYSSCYYNNQIGSIHLSHCFHIFPWLCVWDVCYIIFYHLLYIHSGKNGNSFSLVLCSLWWVQIVGYVLACRSYSFVCTLHHLIIIIVQTLSEDIELIKMSVWYNLSSAWVRLCIFSQLSIIQYVGLCFQFTHFLFDDWENIYVLCLIIIIKSEILTITHCLGLGHETILCAMCASIFLHNATFHLILISMHISEKIRLCNPLYATPSGQ